MDMSRQSSIEYSGTPWGMDTVYEDTIESIENVKITKCAAPKKHFFIDTSEVKTSIRKLGVRKEGRTDRYKLVSIDTIPKDSFLDTSDDQNKHRIRPLKLLPIKK